MRILAASRSTESAIETGGSIREGALSYALVHEGLELGLADFRPWDGKIGLSEWLTYGAQEVPKLIAAHSAKRKYQQPVLFDFAKGHREVLLDVQRRNGVPEDPM
jgi:hypothetical protein